MLFQNVSGHVYVNFDGENKRRVQVNAEAIHTECSNQVTQFHEPPQEIRTDTVVSESGPSYYHWIFICYQKFHYTKKVHGGYRCSNDTKRYTKLKHTYMHPCKST